MSTTNLRSKSAMLLLSASLAAFGGARTANADHEPDHVQKMVRIQGDAVTTSTFAGPKANQGTATFRHENGARTLTWSDDFKIPETPAPHWQVVDSSGNTYLLQRLVIKGDKQNRTITIPAQVKDIAKVQIWCAYAEVVLGEASFPQAAK